MGELELVLLEHYRSLPHGQHTTQELLEWLWLEVKVGIEKWDEVIRGTK